MPFSSFSRAGLLLSVFGAAGCSDYGFGHSEDVEGGSCFDRNYAGESVDKDPQCDFPGEMSDVGNVLDWSLTNWSREGDHSQVSMAPIVASFTDDNGDGLLDHQDTPDVAVISFRESRGMLRVVSGDDGHEIWSITQTNFQPQGGLAVGDIDGDGIIELLAMSADHQVLAYDISDGDATLKWTSQSLVGHIFGEYDNPCIANLDGQGLPEIIVGKAILDADGNLIGYGGAGKGGNKGTTAFAADVDGDGQQEVIVGNAIYTMDGTLVWENSQSDGYPAIADLDWDTYPEIIVSDHGEVWAQDARTGEVAWNIRISGATDSGPPVIADFDGDGSPEIGVSTNTVYAVIDGDGSLMWTADISEDSGFTGAVAFDFDGGGVSEILYLDRNRLWIFAGDDGDVKMWSDMHESPTYMEYAVVADINGDGEAEIISPSAPADGSHDSVNQGLKSFVSVEGEWGPGRSIWNQYAYSITNINDDGTIPDTPVQNWASYNNFRSGAVHVGTGLLAPDLFATIEEVCDGDCDEDVLVAWIMVGNQGQANIPGDVEVVLYGVVAGEMEELDRQVVEGGIPAGEVLDSIRFEFTGPGIRDYEDLQVAIDGGNWAAQDGGWRECQEGNNTASWGGGTCLQ